MTNTGENKDLISEQVQNQVKQLLEEMGLKQYTINISPGSVRGDNYLGIIAKVQVQGRKNGTTVTYNFIVKSAPRNEIFRTLISINLVYRREMYMYDTVFPHFLKFQEERGILKPFKSIAKCYKTSIENGHEALIMENMKENGYQLKNRHLPLDYEHVLLAMKEYGKFHAISFAMRDQNPELFSKLADNTEDSFMENLSKDEFAKTFDKQVEKAIFALDPVQDKTAFEKLKKLKEHFMESSIFLVSSSAAGEYGVIGHGDSWTNNMLFKYEDLSNPNKPTKICFLDWQLARYGSPALDLSYFIFTCTDKDLRDKNYQHMIQEYYDSLSAHLKELGSDPQELFPFSALQEHLKKFSTVGLHMTVMVLFLMTSDTDQIPDVTDITDGEDALDMFNYESKNIEVYNKRIRDVILDFVEFGYL